MICWRGNCKIAEIENKEKVKERAVLVKKKIVLRGFMFK